MVYGFDEDWRSPGQYTSFLERFSSGLQHLAGVNAIIHGSVLDERRFVPNFSDIDCIIILDQGIVTDKEVFQTLAEEYATAQEGNGINVEVNMQDAVLWRTRGWNTFDPSFEAYFQTAHVRIIGKDMRSTMATSAQVSATFMRQIHNLGSVRRAAMTSQYDVRYCQHAFAEHINASIEKALATPKKLMLDYTGTVPLDKVSSITLFADAFGTQDINVDILERAAYLRTHHRERSRLFRDCTQGPRVLFDHLSVMEQLMHRYAQYRSSS